MKFEEIWNQIECDMAERTYRDLRETSPEAAKAYETQRRLAAEVNRMKNRLPVEDEKLLDDYLESVQVTQSQELSHALLQGARVCATLLRGWGLV